jgi:hypothetical protein
MMQYPSPSFPTPPADIAPPKTSVMAIVSLVLAILGFCTGGIAGLVGVILGIIAIIAINKSAGRMQGSGLAIAGICVGAFSLLTSCLYVGLLLPALAKARQQAQVAKAQAGLRSLSSTIEVYSMENEDSLPPVGDWVTAVEQYQIDVDEIAAAPGAQDEGRAFSMNKALEGVRLIDITESHRTVLLFESGPDSPESGGPELMQQPPPRGSGWIVLFADGSVRQVRANELPSLKWDP